MEVAVRSLPDVVADEHSGIGAIDTELQEPARDAFKLVEHQAAWILFEGELDVIDVDLPVLDALVPDGLLTRHHVPPGAVEASAIASTCGAPTERFSWSHHDLLKQPNPERCLAKDYPRQTRRGRPAGRARSSFPLSLAGVTL